MLYIRLSRIASVRAKPMLKPRVNRAGIKAVGVYFSVKNTEAELEAWSPHLAVSSRGYMLG